VSLVTRIMLNLPQSWLRFVALTESVKAVPGIVYRNQIREGNDGRWTTAVSKASVETSRVNLVRCAHWKDNSCRSDVDIATSSIIPSQTQTEEASIDHSPMSLLKTSAISEWFLTTIRLPFPAPGEK